MLNDAAGLTGGFSGPVSSLGGFRGELIRFIRLVLFFLSGGVEEGGSGKEVVGDLDGWALGSPQSLIHLIMTP